MNLFLTTLANIFQLNNIVLMLAGSLFGILVGVMPGLSSVMGMSIMLPFALQVGGMGSVLMMLGIYCGAIYGGSITAILLNTPGTANSAATCLDGHPMAIKMGQPGRALSISTTSSLCGGLLSAVVLLFTAPMLSKVALKFGTAEYFALGIFGLSIVTSVSSKSIIKGIMGAVLGLFLSTIGMDKINGSARFTFDTVYLLGGISFVPVLIGLFAFSQGLVNIEEYDKNSIIEKATSRIKGVFPNKKDMRLVMPTILRSSVIGSLIGIIPGTGGDIASWLGYNEAKRWSKHPEEFGKGSPEGIAAPEAANNAVTGGALVPLLTLGIPGDAATAIMLGALMMLGITPGPLLFQEQTDKVYIIIIGLFVANLIMGFWGYAGVRLFSKIADIPKWIMTPIIFVFCIVGTYALNHTIGDVVVMLVSGIIGFVLLKLDFAIPPIILGMILGGTIENNFRRSLIISSGSLSIFFASPISCALLIIAVASVFYPVVMPVILRRLRKRKAAKNPVDEADREVEADE